MIGMALRLAESQVNWLDDPVLYIHDYGWI